MELYKGKYFEVIFEDWCQEEQIRSEQCDADILLDDRQGTNHIHAARRKRG